MLKISNLFSLFKARKTAGGIADFQQLQKYGIGCEEGDFCKACKKMEFLSEFFPEFSEFRRICFVMRMSGEAYFLSL